ncbi:MAG TPA: hypothetical protein VMZ90_07940 [Vicinamibacterales bacterium]|nr:hypothetical protein [Vicinamibacterales bacterium]
MTLERILRAVALLIAALAFVDPALTRAAQDRPTVVVLQGAQSDRDLALDVAAALKPTFDVSRADLPGAAAYVVAGTDLPEGWRPPTDAHVFTVIPADTTSAVSILRFNAPAEVSLDSIAPIEVEARIEGSGEREVTISLMADGVRLSQTSHSLAGSDTRVRAPLTFVPSKPGLVRLRVEAAVLGRDPVIADRVLDVHAHAWQVLAFDGRPSYAATFVRRALESDPRFKVTTRVVTSRASAIETNAAPSSLTDSASLAAFDLIIVGAPEAFGESEARALQRYARERQGAVILLPETKEGVLLPRLSGQGAWHEDRRNNAVKVSPVAAPSPGGNEVWTAAEFLWPVRWPPLAETLATLAPPSQASSGPLSAVWQMPLGGGRLAVSSAIDGWRSRAGSAAGFSAFWRATAAAMAQATPELVEVAMERRLLTHGQWAQVSVETFAPGEPAARVTGGSTDALVRLWPGAAAASGSGREWSGAFRAPDLPGRYRLGVTVGAGVSGVVEFLVVDQDGDEGPGGRKSNDAPVRSALERDGLSELAASAHQGRVVTGDQLRQLPAQISEIVTSSPSREAWHPLRSVWWLLPFTLCAAGEWWLRRHRVER